MRNGFLLLFAALALGLAPRAGSAADAPCFDAAPGWVKPFPTEIAPSADVAAGAVAVLRDDTQIRFTGAASIRYRERLVRVEAPQGLDEMGTVTLPWDPATERLCIHRLDLIRGGRVVASFADRDDFLVLRRETKLEEAMLDGVLTAAAEVRGLQIGDEIDLAYSVRRADPAIAGMAEEWVDVDSTHPIARARILAHWPAGRDIRWRAGDSLSGAVVRQTDQGTELSWSADHVDPLIQPQGAPSRFRHQRMIAFSGFSGWQDISARFAPLYARAAQLPPDSALHAEIARIAAASADPVARAAAALRLVQEQIRYVFIGMKDGGLVPAAADLTWSRRFGDCKGKTVVLLALLQGLGIDAEPVLVNATDGDGLNARLPMIGLFDHVLVRAVIGGQVYWLDGTRFGDRDLARIAVPGFDWGLPLTGQGAALMAITPRALALPERERMMRIDARGGVTLPAPFEAEVIFRGDSAIRLRNEVMALTPAELDRSARDFWMAGYDNLTIAATATHFDDATGQARLTATGTISLHWRNGQFQADGVEVGYDAKFDRPPGADHDLPYAVSFPFFHSNVETITLPNGGAGFTVASGEIDQTIAGVHYRRHGALAGGVFTATASVQSVAQEFPAAQAPAAQQALRDLNTSTIYLRMPPIYCATPAERAQQAASLRSSGDAKSHFMLGYAFAVCWHLDESRPEFDRAIALDPGMAIAYAYRGDVFVETGDLGRAQSDLDAAARLAPALPAVLRLRGRIAAAHHNGAEAIKNFSAVLAVSPNDVQALMWRAYWFEDAGDHDRALADSANAHDQRPAWINPYSFRAGVFETMGEMPSAAHEADLAAAAVPASAEVDRILARIYAGTGQASKAIDYASRSIALRPSEEAYLLRERARLPQDVAERRADIDAAWRLNPNSIGALYDSALLALQSDDAQGALATIARALAVRKEPLLFLMRGIAYARAGGAAAAAQDFALARAQIKTPDGLNSMCWRLATFDVDLKLASESCSAALAKRPADAATLDSEAFLLLRMQRYRDAVKTYSRGLALRPNSASSLYGRAIAERRIGQMQASQTDEAAAHWADPTIAATFASFGVTL